MRSLLVAIGVLLAGRGAEARERALDSARAVCEMCWAARSSERMRFEGDAVQRGQARARHDEARLRALESVYVVQVPAAAYGFVEYDAGEGVLAVDTRRNFRLFDGRADLYASNGEAIAFEVEPEAASSIVSARRGGRQKLRIGFLVSFDQPDSEPCLIRPAGTFTVRADLAWAEIVDGGNRVLARMTTERLDEVVPDAAELAGSGSGAGAAPPGQVTVTPPTIVAEPRRRGQIDEWISAEGAASIAALLEPCRVAGARAGRVVGSMAVAMDVDAAGAPGSVRVEMDSMGNETLAACVVEKIGTVRFPAGRSRARVTLPLLFTDR